MNDVSESHICSVCQKSIPVRGDFVCAFCGSPVVLGKTCPFCRKDGYFLDRLLVASHYEQILAEKMVKALKYDFIASLAGDIASVMIEYLEKAVLPNLQLDSKSLVVTAIPLHPKRLNWRGFNQSELIARKICGFFGWNYTDGLLKRKRNVAPQAQIKNRFERLKNMEAIFDCALPKSLKNKTVIIVDDVSTTGSTLNDCARALKNIPAGQAGVKEVIGFVFARNR